MIKDKNMLAFLSLCKIVYVYGLTTDEIRKMLNDMDKPPTEEEIKLLQETKQRVRKRL